MIPVSTSTIAPMEADMNIFTPMVFSSSIQAMVARMMKMASFSFCGVSFVAVSFAFRLSSNSVLS